MIIEYSSAWDEDDQVFLHWGTGEIDGFIYRCVVESHDEMMSAWDRDLIRDSFKKQMEEVALYHKPSKRLQ